MVRIEDIGAGVLMAFAAFLDTVWVASIVGVVWFASFPPPLSPLGLLLVGFSIVLWAIGGHQLFENHRSSDWQ